MPTFHLQRPPSAHLPFCRLRTPARWRALALTPRPPAHSSPAQLGNAPATPPAPPPVLLASFLPRPSFWGRRKQDAGGCCRLRTPGTHANANRHGVPAWCDARSRHHPGGAEYTPGNPVIPRRPRPPALHDASPRPPRLERLPPARREHRLLRKTGSGPDLGTVRADPPAGMASPPCSRHPRPLWPAPPWPYLLPLGVPAVELLGFGLAHHHGVGGLEVGGVGHQRQGDVAVRHSVDPPVVHAQVVLHIPRALRAHGGWLALPDSSAQGGTWGCRAGPGNPLSLKLGLASPQAAPRPFPGTGASPRRRPPASSRTDRKSAPAPS